MKQENITTLISAEEIQKRVEELGKKISQDYAGKEITLVCTLKGAFVFTADLARSIDCLIQCEFIRISSYGDATESSGKVNLKLDVAPETIEGKDVIIVEDIVDTGNSIKFLREHLSRYQPASLKVASFLLKEEALQHKVTVDYLAFKVDPLFVIGYGLDYQGYYRDLPYLGVMASSE